MVLACQVISQDHVIKESCDSVGNSNVSYHPAKVGGHRHCANGDVMVLACHVISQDHRINGSCDFMGSSPSR